MLKKNILSTNLFYNYQFFKGVSVSNFGLTAVLGFKIEISSVKTKICFCFVT